jgi:hypothetical protein
MATVAPEIVVIFGFLRPGEVGSARESGSVRRHQGKSNQGIKKARIKKARIKKSEPWARRVITLIT